MATKRIYDLTNATTLNAADKVPVDRSGGSTRSILATDFANAVRPFASTLEAQTGTATDKTMTPARTFDAITARFTNAALAGTSTAPTAAFGTSTTQIASTAFVDQSFAGALRGAQTNNPYAGPYESWRVGIGGIGYFDRQALGNNALRIPQGTVQVEAPFMWGDLNNATAMTNSALSNRPGAILGLTAPEQVGGYNETGVTAHLAQADLVPVMARVTGTYTSSSFTLTTPLTETATVQVKVGMFVRTDTPRSHQGQITAITRNGSGQVTAIAVAGFFRTGEAVASAPSNSVALILNPMDKAWGRLATTFLSAVSCVASTTSGSSLVNIAAPSLAGLLLHASAGHRISGPGLAAGTRITSYDPVGNNVFIWPAATGNNTNASGYKITLGTLYGSAHGDENDIFNDGPDFEPHFVRQTVSWTNGSEWLTSVPNIGAWNVGIAAYGVPTAFPFGNFVTELDFSGSRVRLKYPANATGSGIVVGFNYPDEAGVAYDAFSPINRAQSAFTARANWENGFVAYGGRNAGFIFRPGRESPRSRWAYVMDMRHNESNTPTEGFAGIVDVNGNVVLRIGNDGTYNGAELNNLPWATWTPTIAASSGSITTVDQIVARTKKIGKTRFIDLTFRIANNGTGGGNLSCTLPEATLGSISVAGVRDDTVAALFGRVFGSSASMLIQVAGGGYAGATNGVYKFLFSYEVA